MSDSGGRPSEAAATPQVPTPSPSIEARPVVSTSRGLALSVNMNQFYMEGLHGLLDVRLENMSETTFEWIEVEVSGDLLDCVKCWNCALTPCENLRKLWQVKPPGAGVTMVTFRVNTQEGDCVNSYWAEGDLLVFANTQNLHDIKVQADDMVNISAGTGKQMGNSINNNINIMVDQGKICNVNDLMMQYRKLQPSFQLVPLRFDPARSDELTQALRRRQQAAGAKRVIEPERGARIDSASLHIEGTDCPANILLVAKPCVALGKNRRNDIVTRFLPRSPENDAQSNQMSRDHCRIELRPGGVVVVDEGSVNGTTLDGQKVDAGGRLVHDQAQKLVLGDVLHLSLRCIGGRLPQPCGDYADAMGEPAGQMWELAGSAGPAALLLERIGNLDADDRNGCESYCLIYRAATIGCGEDCAIRISNKGLEPLHAALLHWGDRFFLENLSLRTDVAVNDRMLGNRELIPLSLGDCIRIARLEIQFDPRSQLYVDM